MESFNYILVKESLTCLLSSWGYDTYPNFRLKNSKGEDRIVDIYAKHVSGKIVLIEILEKPNKREEKIIKSFYEQTHPIIFYESEFRKDSNSFKNHLLEKFKEYK